MNADEFKVWRTRLGLTQVEAADQLKLTPRAVQHYEGGTRGISDQIAMLTFAVEGRHWRGHGTDRPKGSGRDHFHDPRDVVETPWPFFRRLDGEFHFTLDVCALPPNAKCVRYFTPEVNGLAQRWSGVCWMNPPYFQGRIGAWLAKAYHEVQENDCVVVAFVHSAFDTTWWHDFVLRAAEIRFVRGRLASCGRAAIVVFRRGKTTPKTSTISANG